MNNLISILTSALIGFTPSSSNNEYIVKTSKFLALQQFVSQNDLSVEPLINYPNPSQDVLKNFGDYYILTGLNDSLINITKKLDGVNFIETNGMRYAGGDTFKKPYKPNDPMFDQQWAPEKIEADWAWNLTRGDNNVIIGILDSGVDTTHEDLKENLIPGRNFVSNNSNVQDKFGHGTHVIGIVGARIDNNIGMAGIAGNCSIMPLQVFNNNGRIDVSTEVNAIMYAADNKSKVINMSIYGDGLFQTEKNAVDYAYNKGCFLVACAGNDNKDASNVYPSGYEHVMGIGASTSSDSRWSSSNFGSTVDVYAPGENVLTTELGGSYTTHSGTSDACPHVAGIAALIWSAEPTLTNQQVWDRIVQTSDTITIDKGKVLRINARKALGVEKDTTGISERDRKIVDYKLNIPSIITGSYLNLHWNGPSTHIDIYDGVGRFVSGITTTEKKDYVFSITGAAGKYFVLTKTEPILRESFMKIK